MEILTQLKPAETYLLDAGAHTDYKNLLKYTMADLLLKKALKSEFRSVANSEEQDHIIVRGENFQTYKTLPYEVPFLAPFQYDVDFEILFKDLLKVTYQRIGGQRRFVFDLMRNNQDIRKSIKNGFFKRLFNTISLTDEGQKKQSNIRAALQKLEDTYPQLIEENPEAAKEILRKIGGNIYLLKSFDFELLRKLDQGIHESEREEREAAMAYDVTPDFAIWTFLMFDTFSDDFDSTFDSFDEGGSSWGGDFGGDSGGDSGCSGCSGCGGCGGCGG